MVIHFLDDPAYPYQTVVQCNRLKKLLLAESEPVRTKGEQICTINPVKQLQKWKAAYITEKSTTCMLKVVTCHV